MNLGPPVSFPCSPHPESSPPSQRFSAAQHQPPLTYQIPATARPARAVRQHTGRPLCAASHRAAYAQLEMPVIRHVDRVGNLLACLTSDTIAAPPEDQALFAETEVPGLQSATTDLSWLLTRGSRLAAPPRRATTQRPPEDPWAVAPASDLAPPTSRRRIKVVHPCISQLLRQGPR